MLALAFAFAPHAHADKAAAWRIPKTSIAPRASVSTSGTAGAEDNTLPAFLRGNNLNTHPAPPEPVTADVFLSGTDVLLHSPTLPRRGARGGAAAGTGAGGRAMPSFFSFLPDVSGTASTTIDARNTQAALAGLVESSTIAPRPRTGAKPLADTAAADEELRDIVAWQREIFAKAAAAGDKLHPDDFHSQLQQLAQRYDKLLRTHANYVGGMVSYGLLLNQIGMKKEGAALMWAANNLDGRIPLVKNELGNYCAEEGRPLIAFAFYTAAIELAPREPLYYYQLGSLLAEARDTFLKDAPGMWTRGKIDEAMQAAFRYAMELSPGDWRFAYRYGQSYYDLGLKEWEDALQFWRAFEKKLAPGFEQEVARLHQAKILLELRRPDDAQKLLDTVADERLAKQRSTVVAALEAYRDSLARPNPNIEVITGSADEPDPSVDLIDFKVEKVDDPNFVVTRMSPPNRYVSKDYVTETIAKLRVGMTKEEVLSVMQAVSSSHTVEHLGGTGASRICFFMDFQPDGKQQNQKLWVDMGGHAEEFRVIKIGTPEPR